MERVRRLADLAEEAGLMVYFENHNKEPDLAEVHYIPYNVE
ncbi:MAG TPA: sugar phosphate isomerase/epimerase, partial [Acidobacteria bacterium]|nr:sugar phosphate isomerase/epimerase [Acidobacteriota bacterium]